MGKPDLRSELAATEEAVRSAERHLADLMQYRDQLRESVNGQPQPDPSVLITPAESPAPPQNSRQASDLDLSAD